jgi:hypothetical protein
MCAEVDAFRSVASIVRTALISGPPRVRRSFRTGGREFVDHAIQGAAHTTLVGITYVFDGVRVIESTASKFDFALYALRYEVVSAISPNE